MPSFIAFCLEVANLLHDIIVLNTMYNQVLMAMSKKQTCESADVATGNAVIKL